MHTTAFEAHQLAKDIVDGPKRRGIHWRGQPENSVASEALLPIMQLRSRRRMASLKADEFLAIIRAAVAETQAEMQNGMRGS